MEKRVGTMVRVGRWIMRFPTKERIATWLVLGVLCALLYQSYRVCRAAEKRISALEATATVHGALGVYLAGQSLYEYAAHLDQDSRLGALEERVDKALTRIEDAELDIHDENLRTTRLAERAALLEAHNAVASAPAAEAVRGWTKTRNVYLQD